VFLHKSSTLHKQEQLGKQFQCYLPIIDNIHQSSICAIGGPIGAPTGAGDQ